MSYSNQVKRALEGRSESRGCCARAFKAGRAERIGAPECADCGKAFFRGLFLACGSISDPRGAYHLEFALADGELAGQARAALSGEGIFLKLIRRRNRHVLYLKSSEQIEDFLYYINAEKFSFELMKAKILKSVRNDANRSRNFESANLDKMSRASAEQIAAIERLKSSGRFESLPDELKRTAEIRLENIEMSLAEIGAASEPAVTKSAILHRMRKIVDLADEKY